MLAAPPAAAMAYVKPSRGLEPSVYGGGGSRSSELFADDVPLVSVGSAAFTSASAADGATESSGGTACTNDGGAEGSGSVIRTFAESGTDGVGKYREEKGGGLAYAEFEGEAEAGPGYSGSGSNVSSSSGE